ncbi:MULTISPECIES: DUF2849 domain-containing protein [unclassified Gluconobacter]|uniref:DUF2849 domain-containing protein n=1 Tax=unclassified Gluconobacter TaxID=2644261 RepID=UPI0019231DAE|nr:MULTISPECIES: DUF2849 domain-containing protein [unclassified Gluconobacter]
MKRPVRVGAGEKLVLTANRLLDGRIVWRGHDGHWTAKVAAAEKLDADAVNDVLESAQARAQHDGVVGVYEVAVRDVDPPEPVTVRERIRAHGPTVHPEFSVEAGQ